MKKLLLLSLFLVGACSVEPTEPRPVPEVEAQYDGFHSYLVASFNTTFVLELFLDVMTNTKLWLGAERIDLDFSENPKTKDFIKNGTRYYYVEEDETSRFAIYEYNGKYTFMMLEFSQTALSTVLLRYDYPQDSIEAIKEKIAVDGIPKFEDSGDNTDFYNALKNYTIIEVFAHLPQTVEDMITEYGGGDAEKAFGTKLEGI